MRGVSTPRMATAVLCALWITSFSLAAYLTGLDQRSPRPTDAGTSVLEALLGESRKALGASLYETADTYFHRGVPQHREETLRGSWLKRLSEHIHPDEHAHSTGPGVNDVIPWLRFATAMNPRHVEAYLVASYFLAGSADRTDLALEVLGEAVERNPNDYQLHAEQGRVHLMRDESVRATISYDRALRLWPGGNEEDPEQARIDLARILEYRALLYERSGDAKSALALLRHLQTIGHTPATLAARLAALERGECDLDRPIPCAGEFELPHDMDHACPLGHPDH